MRKYNFNNHKTRKSKYLNLLQVRNCFTNQSICTVVFALASAVQCIEEKRHSFKGNKGEEEES